MPAHPKQKRIVNKKLIEEVRKTNICACTGKTGSKFDPVVVHHLITVKAGGHDIESNLLPILNSLHTPVIHVIGITEMARRYPLFKRWLTDKGWNYIEEYAEWVPF